MLAFVYGDGRYKHMMQDSQDTANTEEVKRLQNALNDAESSVRRSDQELGAVVQKLQVAAKEAEVWQNVHWKLKRKCPV